nr:RUN and FYVE domain-containing protein 4 [Dasypus novemcinctus]
MFTESHCSNSSQTRGRRTRRMRESPKEIAAAGGGPRGVPLEEPHPRQAGCPGDRPGEDCLEGFAPSQPHSHLPSFLEKKKDNSGRLGPAQETGLGAAGEELQQDQKEGAPKTGICLENSTRNLQGQGNGAKGVPEEAIGTEDKRAAERMRGGEAKWGHVQRRVSSPRGMMEEAMLASRQEGEMPSTLGEPWVLQGLGKGVGSTTQKPQEQTGVASVTRREDQAEVPLQEVKSLRRRLQKAQERARHQEQLLKEQQRELKALQEQLSRCQEELEQKREEAERRDGVYQEELGRQQDLVEALKRRVLELIQEKDSLWQKVQHLSSVGPGGCVGCNKTFHWLSRRYPCRLCGGLVCHSCSADYKKRDHCCPPCAQREGAQVT